jgi:hypothetical protein
MKEKQEQIRAGRKLIVNKDHEDLAKKVKSVFSIGEGKDVYDYLMNKYYDRKGFVKGMDALELAYREGQRSVMFGIKSLVDKKLN